MLVTPSVTVGVSVTVTVLEAPTVRLNCLWTVKSKSWDWMMMVHIPECISEYVMALGACFS